MKLNVCVATSASEALKRLVVTCNVWTSDMLERHVGTTCRNDGLKTEDDSETNGGISHVT